MAPIVPRLVGCDVSWLVDRAIASYASLSGAKCFSFSAKWLPNTALQRTDLVFSTPIRVDRPPLNFAVRLLTAWVQLLI
ncbi:MAG: hypothetical protein HC936_11270 [Leptolyngbyaceae cyanobacterium SU_3_3]|nr:hypothetical protein [Leptolyngbyaceae cyanobacterium SU_3_3]